MCQLHIGSQLINGMSVREVGESRAGWAPGLLPVQVQNFLADPARRRGNDGLGHACRES